MRNSSAARWFGRLAPDLALSLALLSFIYCLYIFDGGRRLFRDSDTGWHLVTGERILSEKRLPRVDPYSFSLPGREWFAWEWSSDVGFALANRAAGLRGVAMLAAAAIALSTWLWVRWQWKAGGDFLLVCVTASLLLSTVNLHWLARPHIFSWPLMLAVAAWAESRRQAGFGRWAWVGLVALSIAWANVHASFLMAPAWLLACALGSGLNAKLWGEDRRLARNYALAAVVSLAATLVNPYGWQLHRHVLAYLGDQELLARVGEFQSFNFHVAGSGQIVAGLMVVMAGAVLAIGQRRLEHAMLACGLVWMALTSARGLPVMALLGLPMACGAITRWLEGYGGLQEPARRALDGVLGYSQGLRRLDRHMHGVGTVLLAMALAAVALPHAGFPEEEFPVQAASAVARLPESARILAPDKFGGYLIYRFGGARKVFFDGRSDYYGAEFLKRYLRLVELSPGWQGELGRWQFTHALLPVSAPLSPALQAAGWNRLYEDRVAVLLERPATAR